MHATLAGPHGDLHFVEPPYWHCCPSGCRWGWGKASWSTRPLHRLHQAESRGGWRGWLQLPVPRHHLQAKSRSLKSHSRVWMFVAYDFFLMSRLYHHHIYFSWAEWRDITQTITLTTSEAFSMHQLHCRFGEDVQTTRNLWSCSYLNLLLQIPARR